jgi:hypothetical protein
LNGTQQFLAYADDVNIMGENTDTIKKHEALLVASKEVCLKVNPQKTKYMLISRYENGGQKYCIKIANRSFEQVAQFKYLGTRPTDQNCVQGEIKSKLNSWNDYYRAVQSFVFPPAVEEREYYNIQNRNSATRFVWV